MQTNILLFLLFALCSALVVRLLPPTWKRIGILVFSLFFYGICDLRFLWLITVEILWSYWAGIQLEKESSIIRKAKLAAGIIPIIVMLFFFKYYGFFVKGRDALRILMPLGISYYSFKMISYLCDIYLQKRKAEASIVNYAVYVSYFPQILCGPISRSEEILETMNSLSNPSEPMIAEGISLIISGLFKKIVIADRLNNYVNCIFADYNTYPAITLWMAAFFFSIQLYCDFSGYSEIAIGVSNLLGISCKPNFYLPEFSYSIKDFWGRWHISLSSWLRDYIYIPLGGNRKGTVRRRINIVITFLVSGIWHGSTMNYLFWGIWHGLFHLIPVKRGKSRLIYMGQMAGTYLIVMLGWIFFQVQTVTDGLNYILRMFQNIRIDYETIVASVLPFTNDYASVAYLLSILLLILFLVVCEYLEFSGRENGVFFKGVRPGLYIGCIILFGMIGQNSFLYANY